jgi:hypothetical protein
LNEFPVGVIVDYENISNTVMRENLEHMAILFDLDKNPSGAKFARAIAKRIAQLEEENNALQEKLARREFAISELYEMLKSANDCVRAHITYASSAEAQRIADWLSAFEEQSDKEYAQLKRIVNAAIVLRSRCIVEGVYNPEMKEGYHVEIRTDPEAWQEFWNSLPFGDLRVRDGLGTKEAKTK